MCVYYAAIKKNEIFSFVTTWVDFEGIMVSEINRERQYYFTSLWNQKRQK